MGSILPAQSQPRIMRETIAAALLITACFSTAPLLSALLIGAVPLVGIGRRPY